MEALGRDLETGLPKALTVTSTELAAALDGPLGQILEGISEVLGRTPPELAADITREGILLTGGGALLRGLSQRISEGCGLPVHLAEDPLSTVIHGLGLSLESAFEDRAARA